MSHVFGSATYVRVGTPRDPYATRHLYQIKELDRSHVVASVAASGGGASAGGASAGGACGAGGGSAGSDSGGAGGGVGRRGAGHGLSADLEAQKAAKYVTLHYVICNINVNVM